MYDSLEETISQNIGRAFDIDIDTLTLYITQLRFVTKDDSKVHIEVPNAPLGIACTLKRLGQYHPFTRCHVL